MEFTLPKQFASLQSLVNDWALASETARNTKRRASSMQEIQDYYDAVQPQLDAIMAYLNGFTLAETPEEAKTVLYLALMFMELSTAVELYQEVDVPEAFPAERYNILSPDPEHYMTA